MPSRLDPLSNQMFKLAFLVAVAMYIWFQSLFVGTSHTVVGDRHLFGYSWIGLVTGFGFNVIPIGAAWFLWRVKKDRLGAGLMLLAIPLFAAFVMPQLVMERVEVTPNYLRHRREPAHSRFNVDIAFDEIASAVEVHNENALKGYAMTLKDGRTLELPANTVLTAAQETIAEQLRRRNIPVSIKMVHRESR